MTETNTILIVGGGWAGLSCAVELTRLGHPVQLFESARQLGGRARRVTLANHSVDNGQHLLLGAYHHTLDLLTFLGVPDTTFLRQPLHLSLRDRRNKHIEMKSADWPAPFNLLLGLLMAKGFSLTDRLRAIRFGARLWRNKVMPERDISVTDLLQQEHQTATLIQQLWEPLCLASLNTPIALASAQVFIRVVGDAFCQAQHDSDLLLPQVDLSTLLPDRAAEYIVQHGGRVHLSQRVDELQIEKRQVTGLSIQDKRHTADHVVLALPPHACQPLIKPFPALQTLAYALSGFSYEPICTVYIQYPVSVSTDQPMQGFIGTTAQWVIDRHITGHPGLMAVVISSRGPHLDMEHTQLADHICAELKHAFPHWPQPDDVQILCEKRATFSCRVDIQRIRPENTTAIRHLWLAGDHTNTGYPATIEGAVQSGLRCAQRIHENKQ
jgi:squalene-associated FAD-dependent desaturase